MRTAWFYRGSYCLRSEKRGRQRRCACAMPAYGTPRCVRFCLSAPFALWTQGWDGDAVCGSHWAALIGSCHSAVRTKLTNAHVVGWAFADVLISRRRSHCRGSYSAANAHVFETVDRCGARPMHSVRLHLRCCRCICWSLLRAIFWRMPVPVVPLGPCRLPTAPVACQLRMPVPAVPQRETAHAYGR